ncbi:MAG: hypothetical protein PVF68_16225, partial [Acidobacteriota bacterium]
MRPKSLILAAGTLLALAATAAPAQELPKLRIDLQVERELLETTPAGEQVLRREPAEDVAAGDVLVYTLNIQNEGQGPAHRARVVDPIPPGTVLIPDSVAGDSAEITYSIDGGDSFAAYPITRQVAGADGSQREVPVSVEEYTHLRWTLTETLDPGQVRTAN